MVNGFMYYQLTTGIKEGEAMNEDVKVLKQKIDELEAENLDLRNKIEDLEMDKDNLVERILDLEACK